MLVFVDVDPRTLRLPGGRLAGADPVKFARQFSKHGLSTAGMPDIEVVRCKDGEMQILNGVTRATRVAKFLPGRKVRVVITEDKPNVDLSGFPTVGDRLP